MSQTRTELPPDPSFLRALIGLSPNYCHTRRLDDGRYACIVQFMFSTGIITGRIGDLYDYEDRWCYRGLARAKAALDAWDGKGEPAGWHCHPASGRRLAETNDCYDDDGNPVPIGRMYVRW